LGLKYPSVFSRLAVVSPSVWWADKQIVQYTLALPRKPSLRIWLDTGTKEGRDAKEAQETVTGARLLRDALVKQGWKAEKDLKYLEAEGAEHNERAWAERVAPMLEFLFGKKS
jgi:predicted alpha/beta superfamily hydrolase